MVGFESDAAHIDADRTATYVGNPNGTGGFAYGDVTNRTVFYTAGNPNQIRFQGGKSGFETGYTYGAGIEYAMLTGSFLNFFK